MISVAEQFSNLRNTLGSILGIFTILRWFRTLIAKITGRPPPADATSLTPSAFASFQGLTSSAAHTPNAPPTPSKKPFIIFLLAVFGLPYLMSKLIRSLVSQTQNPQQNQQLSLPGPEGQNALNQPIDPLQLTFCRVLYDYEPPNPSAAEGIDLPVKKGDLVAVLSKLDPLEGKESEWWRCRSRDGRVGYLPGVYLEEILRKPPKEIEEGRVKTMSDSSGSRANSLVEREREREKVPVGKEVKGTAWGVDEFQKGGFYS